MIILDPRFSDFNLIVQDVIGKRIPCTKDAEEVLELILKSASPDQNMLLAPTVSINGKEVKCTVAVFPSIKQLIFGMFDEICLRKMIDRMGFVAAHRH